MTERDYLARQFEENRGRLRGVAYRMLGSLNEADDAVQEAWLRLNRSDSSEIENLGGWLTTVVARVCLDMLRSRGSRHEESLTGQATEPAAPRRPATDPEQEALLADSVSLGGLKGGSRAPRATWGQAHSPVRRSAAPQLLPKFGSTLGRRLCDIAFSKLETRNKVSPTDRPASTADVTFLDCIRS